MKNKLILLPFLLLIFPLQYSYSELSNEYNYSDVKNLGIICYCNDKLDRILKYNPPFSNKDIEVSNCNQLDKFGYYTKKIGFFNEKDENLPPIGFWFGNETLSEFNFLYKEVDSPPIILKYDYDFNKDDSRFKINTDQIQFSIKYDFWGIKEYWETYRYQNSTSKSDHIGRFILNRSNLILQYHTMRIEVNNDLKPLKNEIYKAFVKFRQCNDPIKDEKLFLDKLNKIKNNLKIDYNEKTKKNKI